MEYERLVIVEWEAVEKNSDILAAARATLVHTFLTTMLQLGNPPLAHLPKFYEWHKDDGIHLSWDVETVDG